MAITEAEDLGPGDLARPALIGTAGPPPRPGHLVPREATVKRLLDAGRLVALRAPAGFGKTCCLQLWDDAERRPFAWATLDRRDDDPRHLVRHLGAALDHASALDPDTAALLQRPGGDPLLELLPAVADDLARRGPSVLVLDDVHAVTSPAAGTVLRTLVDLVPDGSTLALAGRTSPRGVARHRLDDVLVEVGAATLAFDADEARALLAGMGVVLDPGAVADLVERTEGWAAGLHLAGLRLAAQPAPGRDAAFTGRDRLVAEYLVDEVLAPLDDANLAFLERTSILDRVSVPLALDLLGEDEPVADHVRSLEDLGSLLVVPIGHDGTWFRYHRLVTDLLRSRLQSRDPATFAALHDRASRLLERAGDLDGAFDHAIDGGLRARASELVLQNAPGFVVAGEVGRLARWLDRLAPGDLEDDPSAALALAWLGIGQGDVGVIERGLAAAARAGADHLLPDGITSVAIATASLRCFAGTRGIGGIVEDSDVVLTEGTPAMRPWWAIAMAHRGVALSMAGRVEEARRSLHASLPALASFPALAAAVEGHLTLIALHVGDADAAVSHERAAAALRRRHDIEGLPLAAVTYAIGALMAARSGQRREALHDLAVATALVGHLERVPRTVLLVHVTAARAALVLDDRPTARALLRAADRCRSLEPAAVRLLEELDGLHHQLDGPAGATRLGPPLTPAELRVLPYLATHLSLKEIAAELVISRNTAKSHAMAIYRKLGVTSRSEAVATATRLGLLDS